MYEKIFPYGEKPRGVLERDLENGVREMAVCIHSKQIPERNSRRIPEILSFCIFQRKTKREIFIDYLGVSETHRGSGLGKHLLETVLSYADSDEDAEEVSLFCPEENIPFYSRFQFTVVGVVFGVGEIWFRMTKNLKPIFQIYS